MNQLFWIFFCFSLLFGETLGVGYKVKAENCSSSDEKILRIQCNTHQTKISIQVDFINLFNQITVTYKSVEILLIILFPQVFVQFYNEKNGKYNSIFKVPRINWCKLTKGQQNTNMLMKSLVDALKSHSPNMFHECPFQGVHEISNFIVPQSMVSILPVGIYRASVKIIEESSKASMFISLGFEVIN